MLTKMLTNTWNLTQGPLPTSLWPQRTFGAELGHKGTEGFKQESGAGSQHVWTEVIIIVL